MSSDLKKANEEARRAREARVIGDCSPGWLVRLVDGRLVVIGWITNVSGAFVREVLPAEDGTHRRSELFHLASGTAIARIERDQRYYLNTPTQDEGAEFDPVRGPDKE